MPSKESTFLEVLLCPEKMLSEGLPEIVKSTYTSTKIMSVCKHEPKCKKDWIDWGLVWPVLFKPNEIDKQRDSGLPREDLETIKFHLNQLHAEVKLVKSIIPESAGFITAGLLIDPLNGKILSSTSETFGYLNDKSNGLFYKSTIWSSGFVLIEGLASKLRGEFESGMDIILMI